MMQEMKQWAIGICFTLIATAIFSMFIPHGNMERVMKFTLSIFFLTCLFLPFLSGMPQVSWEAETVQNFDYGNIAEQMNNQVKRLGEANLRRAIAAILAEQGMQAEKIEVDVNISADNSISINSITVVLGGSESKNQIKIQELLSEKTGISVKVLLSGE